MESESNTRNETSERSEMRKKDHIEMAFQSRQDMNAIDQRFYYEPMLTAHPDESALEKSIPFAGKELKVPIWVSSMTGGTEKAETINRNLAMACAEFGMGFGLGSCRSLLEGKTNRWKDFDFRSVVGDKLPFYANLGIAQLERVNWSKVEDLVGNLKADGLIVHVNPLQEAMQPEGDRFSVPPVETIQSAVENTSLRIIVKEVGQGFGKGSLKALMKLPLQAIEFGAHGGTNFSKLELLRSDEEKRNVFAPVAAVGHTAEEMVGWTNVLKGELGPDCKVSEFIISGGVKNFLDGYYFVEKLNFSAVYGQASGFLKHATGDYQRLKTHVENQIRGYQLAKSYLRIK